jgi:hypothetical protein
MASAAIRRRFLLLDGGILQRIKNQKGFWGLRSFARFKVGLGEMRV